MHSTAILVALALLAANAAAHSSPKCTLALNNWVTKRNGKNMKIESASNSDMSFNGTGIFPSVSLARVTLAPCGVRMMHTHNNVDELLYVLSGSVGASVAYANGTICEQGILNAGDSFLYPRNLIHSARNPSCTKFAVVLGFFTAFDNALINVPMGAFNQPGSPFAAYIDPNQKDSLSAASDATTLAYDPVCLARCGFGTTFGQNAVTMLP